MPVHISKTIEKDYRWDSWTHGQEIEGKQENESGLLQRAVEKEFKEGRSFSFSITELAAAGKTGN